MSEQPEGSKGVSDFDTDASGLPRSPTDIGEPKRERVVTKPGRIDITDPNALVVMAGRMAIGPTTRSVTNYSVNELRALGVLTCQLAEAVGATGSWLNALDARAPKDEIQGRFAEMVKAIAPFRGEPS